MSVGTYADNVADMDDKGRRPRKLSADQVRTVRRRHASGASTLELATAFAIHPSTVRRIVARHIYRNVSDVGDVLVVEGLFPTSNAA